MGLVRESEVEGESGRGEPVVESLGVNASVSLKVGSWNVRGLGGSIKKDEVRKFVLKNGLDFCCIQETKVEEFSETLGLSIGIKDRFGWCVENTVGRAGGIVSFWDGEKFEATGQWSLGGAVTVLGVWKPLGLVCCVINVYAPCFRQEKLILWGRIRSILEQVGDALVCVIGDFNAVLDAGEMCGLGNGSSSQTTEMREFQEFVNQGNLLDLNLQGRQYTWYKSNGASKSRIDRALVNEKWLRSWPNSVMRGLNRTVSDHCAVLLDPRKIDWGPKPFRFVNAWCSHPEFNAVVSQSWAQEGIKGWTSYVIKEKLKRLRGQLKWWNKEVFGQMDWKIEEKKK